MAYDAGRIEASAALDRDPFLEGLRMLRAEGNAFARERFTATADVDTGRARRAIADLDALAQALAREKIVIKAEISGDAMRDLAKLRAELAALRAEQDKLGGASTKATRAHAEQAKQVSVLGVALAALLPMVGPLVAFTAAGAAGFGAMGAAGILAFKGIKDEVKDGTAAGKQYMQMWTGLRGELSAVSRQSALGAQDGLQQATNKIIHDGPQLQAMFAGISKQTGDIANHLIGGVLGAFHTLSPLVRQFLGDVERGSGAFERWSTGGGLQKFTDWTQRHLPEIEHDLGAVAKAIVQIFAAGSGQGLVILNVLGELARSTSWLIEHVPGVVPILTNVYLAMQLYRGLGGATAALKAFAAAQAAAGAAGAGGAAGTAAGLLGRLRAPLVVFAAAALSARALTTDMTKLQAGSNGLTQSLYELGHLDFKSFGQGLIGKDPLAKAFDKWKSQISDVRNLEKQLAAESASHLTVSNAGQAPTPNLNAFDTSRAKAYAEAVNSVTLAYANMRRENTGAALSQVGENYANLQQRIQANVDVTDKFVKLGGGVIETYHGVAYGQNTWNAALQQFGNDGNAALGFIHGQIDGMNKNRDTINDLIMRQDRLSRFQSETANKYGLTTAQVDLYSRALGANGDAITKNSQSLATWEYRVGAVAGYIKNGSTALEGFVSAVDTFDKAGDTLASRAQLIGSVMVALNGDTLSYAGTMSHAAVANKGVVDAMTAQARAAIDLKTGAIDYHNAASGPLLDSLQQLQTAAMNAAAATYQHEVSIGNTKNAMKDASDVYYNDTHNALIAEARQLGLTDVQARKLADTYFKWPKDAKTQIAQLGGKAVQDVLGKILNTLIAISQGHPVRIDPPHVDPVITQINRVRDALLSIQGGVIVGVQFGGTNGAKANAYGNIVQFANGGIEDHSPAIFKAQPGTVRVFAEPETSWEAYIPGANDGRRPRAKAIAKEAVSRLGGVAFFESGGFSGVTAPPAPKHHRAAGGSSSLPGQSIGSLDALINALLSDITSLGQRAKLSAATVQVATNSIVSTLRRAAQAGFTNDPFVAMIQRENTVLIAEVNKRVDAAKHLADARKNLADVNKLMAEESAKVQQNVMGGFDIGTSGGGYAVGIKSSLEQTLADAKKFASLRGRALAMGLSPALLQQLTEEGPKTAGRNLEAIVNAGQGYVAQINQEYAQLGDVARQIGGMQAQDTYGAQQAAATKDVAHWSKVSHDEQVKINREIAAIQAQLRGIERAIAAQAHTAHELALQRARGG